MKYVSRYDIVNNKWLYGYYLGSRFYVLSKIAA